MAPTWRKPILVVLSMILGAVCFSLAARNVDPAEAKRIFASSDWRWIVAGIAIFGADLLLRTARWRMILSHRQDIQYFRLARGLFVGYAINILLPARLGELFRADYTARLTNVARSVILASIFLERLLDLFAVLIVFGVGLALAGVENPAINRVVSVAIIALLVGMVLVYMTIFRAARRGTKNLVAGFFSKAVPETVANRAMEMIRDFAGLIDIVRTPRFALVVAITIPIWTLESLSVFSICRAVGLELYPPALMALLGGASLSTLFPTGPGFVGSYQFGYVMVLRNFSIPDTLSLVAATGVQVYVMGFYAILGLLVWIVVPLFSSFSSLGSQESRS